MIKFTMFNLRTKKTFNGTEEDFYKGKKIPFRNLKKGERFPDYWICLKEEIILEPVIITPLEQTEIEEFVDEVINEEVNDDIFRFKHTSGETFHGSKEEFIKAYNLNKGSVTKLLKNTINTTKGWKLI